jgi:hypothetical protein
MPPESVELTEQQRTCDCGYTVKKNDCFYVIDMNVWHLICYSCNNEFVI